MALLERTRGVGCLVDRATVIEGVDFDEDTDTVVVCGRGVQQSLASPFLHRTSRGFDPHCDEGQ